jgi:hypothetical protein
MRSPPDYIDAIDVQLRRSGLEGPALDLKLSGYNRALERFRLSPARRALRSVMRWANVLLGSIVAAIGAGEALKELKESIEAGVEDQEDSEQ